MVMKLDSKVNIPEAVRLLRAGKLVAFPTETVYGLGADASNEIAISQIFHVKKRPNSHPLIVHFAKIEQIDEWARDVSPLALQLARAFWPGPLTLILKKQAHVSPLLTGGQETIGVRIPNQKTALALLAAFGGGIAAPSANMFTRISPTSAEAVAESLDEGVSMILDDGPCAIGLESTIVDMTAASPVILRQGMITADQISQVIGLPVTVAKPADQTSAAPGMHPVHYAPFTPALLMRPDAINLFLKIEPPEAFPIILLLRTRFALPPVAQVFYVMMPHEPNAYAHELYRVLRAIDREHAKQLIIEDVPDTIEWQAIRDRLQKASGR
jgi:L-threonylcarbamoyladenylate synthase